MARLIRFASQTDYEYQCSVISHYNHFFEKLRNLIGIAKYRKFCVILPIFYYNQVNLNWLYYYQFEGMLQTMAIRNWSMVNIKVDRSKVKEIEKYGEQFHNELEALVDSILSHGYKISMSYVDSRNSYIVTVSGTENSKYNNQTSMSSWSDSALEAFLLCSYKVNVITEGGKWSDYELTSSEWG